MIHLKTKISNNRPVIILLALVVLCLCYNYNLLFNGTTIDYNRYADSEYIIRSYGYAIVDGDFYDILIGSGAHGLAPNGSPYYSSFMLQSLICSFFYQYGVSYHFMDFICATITAVVVMGCSLVIVNRFNIRFGVCFYIVSLLSPFLSMFASNLFFVPFFWFLPAILMYFIMKSLDNVKKIVILATLLYVCVLLKCLCCYEYLSTMLIFTFSIPVLDVLSSRVNNKKLATIVVLTCMFLSLLAFITALLIHSTMLSDSIIDGITKIWEDIVLRRTYGDSSRWEMDALTAESLKSSVFGVLYTYIFGWKEIMFPSVSGNVFPVLLIASSAILFYEVIRKNNETQTYELAILYLLYFVASVSWFVLAKSHSYVHTHMNYAMWYIGFIQVATYVVVEWIHKTTTGGVCNDDC